MFSPRFGDFAILLFISVVSALSLSFLPHANGSSNCYIDIDGKRVKKIDLTDKHIKEDTLTASRGTIIFQYGNNSISAIKSTCPNKTCIHSGSISKPGELIVCVPCRVTVSIGESEKGVDGSTR